MANIKELLTLRADDVARMSRKDLALVVSQLSSAANKRLRRLEKSYMGTESRPYSVAMERGNFSVAGKNQGQLQNEFKRVKDFLTSKTSTVRGWKKERARVYKRIGGGFDNVQSEKAFWKAYRELAKSEKALHNSYGSTETQRLLRTELETAQQLTEEEIKDYRGLFPDDTRDLSSLSNLDLSVVRTIIAMGLDYEQQESKFGGSNASFFTMGGSL